MRRGPRRGASLPTAYGHRTCGIVQWYVTAQCAASRNCPPASSPKSRSYRQPAYRLRNDPQILHTKTALDFWHAAYSGRRDEPDDRPARSSPPLSPLERNRRAVVDRAEMRAFHWASSLLGG